MLGAVAFAALALTGPTGQTDHLWTSDSQPREGARYRAMTWWGEGDFQCGGSIDGKPVEAFGYRSPTHTVCVLVIPPGTAGKTLYVGHSLTVYTTTGVTHADGSVMRKLIGLRAPRAGQPYPAVRYTGTGELECTGAVGKTWLRVTYQRTETGTTCLLDVPKGSAGKWLVFNHSTFEQTPPVPYGTDADGNQIVVISFLHSDGLVRRVLIRR
jgi:hypothetical protein